MTFKIQLHKLIIILLFSISVAFIFMHLMQSNPKETPIGKTEICTAGNLTDNERSEFILSIKAFRSLTSTALIKQFDETSGLFIYKQHLDGRVSADNSDIRQFLASRILARIASENPQLITKHERNISTIFKNWYRKDGDIGYIYRDGKAKLGASAMLVLVLIESPLFTQYEQETKELVNGIIKQMNTDGSFEPWLIEPDYTYDRDYLLTFYSGEAILALLKYSEKTEDKSIYEIAKHAQDYYIQRYVLGMNEYYYPAYVPWHTLSLERLGARSGEKRYREAIFALNDKLLEIQDTNEHVGRFYNPETPQYGSPHASSDAVYTEGLAVAYMVAKRSKDCEHIQKYQDALMLSFKNLQSLQITSLTKSINKNLIGGIMTNTNNGWVRIDSLAHTIDALDQLLIAFDNPSAS